MPDAYVPFPDPRRARIRLDQLTDEATRELLRRLWTTPDALDPSRTAARVTRELAQQLAVLNAQLEAAGHGSEAVTQFLMRYLFAMFAEDVEPIPKGSFTRLLTDYVDDVAARQYLPDALQNLWQKIDANGCTARQAFAILRHHTSYQLAMRIAIVISCLLFVFSGLPSLAQQETNWDERLAGNRADVRQWALVDVDFSLGSECEQGLILSFSQESHKVQKRECINGKWVATTHKWQIRLSKDSTQDPELLFDGKLAYSVRFAVIDGIEQLILGKRGKNQKDKTVWFFCKQV